MVDRWWYQPGAGARVCEEACGLSRTREIDRPSRRVRSKTQNSQYVSRQYKYASPNLPNLRKQLVMISAARSRGARARAPFPPRQREERAVGVWCGPATMARGALLALLCALAAAAAAVAEVRTQGGGALRPTQQLRGGRPAAPSCASLVTSACEGQRRGV